jgi:hypothetical protein
MIDFYWINQARGNYRCNKCGFQYHDGQPETHTCHVRAAPVLRSIEDIREYHEQVLGGHFFNEAKKFNSKIYPEIYPGREGWPIIVTSERQPSDWTGYHPRKYTVRQLNERGGFDTLKPAYEKLGISGFGYWSTLRGARAFADKVAHDQLTGGNHYGEVT